MGLHESKVRFRRTLERAPARLVQAWDAATREPAALDAGRTRRNWAMAVLAASFLLTLLWIVVLGWGALRVALWLFGE